MALTKEGEAYATGLLDAQRIANEVVRQLEMEGATRAEINAAARVSTAILAERKMVES